MDRFDQGIPKDIRKKVRNGQQIVLVDFKNLGNGFSQNSFILFWPEFLGNHSKVKKVRVVGNPSCRFKKPIFALEKSVDIAFKESRLTDADKSLIQKNSLGLVSFTEFLKMKKYNKSKKRNNDILLLGNNDFYYRKLIEHRNYTHFETLYTRYYDEGYLKESTGPWDSDEGPDPQVTEMFMEETTHYLTVFLIPESFRSQAGDYKGKGSYTWVEWEWYQRNPEAMKNVLFVVGHDGTIGPRQNVVGVSSPTNEKHLPLLLDDPDSYLLK
jgi:hypothetical protein